MIRVARKHLGEPSFYCALILALTFVSGLTFGIGYKLYYPMLIFMALFNNMSVKRNNIMSVFGMLLFACLLSILLNDILPVFQAPFRLIGFTILMLGVTPILFSRKKAISCYKLLQYSGLMLIIVGFYNYYLYRSGAFGSVDTWEGNRVYAGTIGTNYLGMLCSIGMIYAMSLLLFRDRLKPLYFWGMITLLLGLFICLLLSSSRNSIASVIVATTFMLYIKNRGRIGKFSIYMAIIVGAVILTYSLWSQYTMGILDKQGGQLDELAMNSREDYWHNLIEDIENSPLYGIGFASISNPTAFSLKTGIIETTSGWLGLFSQMGLIGGIPVVLLTISNMWYLVRRRDGYYVNCLLGGLLAFFIINCIGEGYITTVGCQFAVYFWLTQGTIYCLRKRWINPLEFKPLFLD